MYALSRLRSFLGYPPVRDAQPNPTHYALAALQYTRITPHIITQNVDGLHRKAIQHIWDEQRRQEGILELHGTLHVRAPSPISDLWSELHTRESDALMTMS